jgi:EAL domain-containing protein (putative c-di-GMP-specific phosphodiesterase class I)/DNA-binding response OmpR family regulator
MSVSDRVADAAVPAPARSYRILAVDDDEDILTVLEALLTSAGYEVVKARSGRSALEAALREPPDLVLLDVMMPEPSGWEVCTTLKNAPETRDVPVVMLTVKSDIRDMITSMQAGADDYVTKPFTRGRLLSTVERLLAERGIPGTSRLALAQEQFRNKILLYDAVTQLPSVPVVIDALRDRLLDSRELGVLYLDVEKYSHIEETYGWEAFDALIRAASEELRRMVGTFLAGGDIVAINRPAGSEFYVFTALEPGDPDGTRLARRARLVEEMLRETLDEKFRDRIHKPIGVIAGHSVIRPNAQTRVERAVYRALREAVRVASSREQERAVSLGRTFREILDRRSIETVYQPIFDLNTMAVCGHESLTRGPEGTPFESPDLLFEYAVANDAVWELETLCLISTAHGYRGEPGQILFVNLEAGAIAGIASRGAAVLDPLRKLDRPVVLEVTERSAIRDVPTFRAALDRLRREGFRIAIDDAGSGYASLQAIAELKPDYLKVANTLVTGMAEDSIKRDIVEMLLHVSRRIQAVCVAEGIESESDLAECRRMGIPFGQGYKLGLPHTFG